MGEITCWSDFSEILVNKCWLLGQKIGMCRIGGVWEWLWSISGKWVFQGYERWYTLKLDSRSLYYRKGKLQHWFRLSPMVFRILCATPKKFPGNWLYMLPSQAIYHIHIRIINPSSHTCTCTPVGILLQLGKVLENKVDVFWVSFSGVFVWFPTPLSKTSS